METINWEQRRYDIAKELIMMTMKEKSEEFEDEMEMKEEIQYYIERAALQANVIVESLKKQFEMMGYVR
jgi:hypothetical protein